MYYRIVHTSGPLIIPGSVRTVNADTEYPHTTEYMRMIRYQYSLDDMGYFHQVRRYFHNADERTTLLFGMIWGFIRTLSPAWYVCYSFIHELRGLV